jgi:hypothetical protein
MLSYRTEAATKYSVDDRPQLRVAQQQSPLAAW